MARMRFPQDRATFVYQGPNQPILTPPRTAIEFFADAAGNVRADILWPETRAPIEDAIVYTGEDGLMPEFLGPDDVLLLYAQVVGHNGLYGVEARFSEALAYAQGHQSFQGGHGAPGPSTGVVGGFWLDVDAQQLWGPKVDDVSWPLVPISLAPPAPPLLGWTHQIASPTLEEVIDHPLGFYPSVVYTDAEGDKQFCDVSYPSPSRVVVRFGLPATGPVHLS